MDSAYSKRLIDRLRPFLGAQTGDPELRFRSELALAFGLFELVVTTLSCITELTWGTPALGVIYAVGLVPIVAILFWLRGGHPTTVGTALIATVFALVTATNLATGGHAIGANMALPTVALFGVMMSSPRAGAVWLALVVAEILVVAMLRRSDLAFPIQPNPNWVSTAIDRVPLFFSVGSALIGWMALRALDRYRAKLREAGEVESRARTLAASNAERFTDFAEVAADGFWETDAELRLTYVSRSFAHAMGLDPRRMLGLTPEQAYQLRFPDARGTAAFMAPLHERRPYQDQPLSTLDGDGNKRWLLSHGRPIFDGCGEFSGYRGAVQDVTEQKRSDKALRASEERLRLITENIPALIAYFDQEARYRFCNSLVGKVLGVDNASVIGRTMREVRGDKIYAGLAAHVAAVLRGEPVTFEGEGEFENRHRYFETNYIPDVAADGQILGFYAITFDVTRIKESEIELSDIARRLQLITDHLPAFIVHVDVDERYTFANAYTGAAMEVAPATIIGKRISDVLDATYYAEIKPHVDAALRGETPRFEIVREINGERHHFQSTYVPDINVAGKVVGFFVMSSDITKLKRIEGELRTLAQFDSLTGLANRRRYNERLVDAIARSERTGQTMALMFLDLDHFKAINDSLGHKGGDLVLQEFAKRLSTCVRRTDTVARLAGDEFVIILESLASREEAALVARKIVQTMDEPVDVEGKPRRCSTSIGIAVRSVGEVDGEALLQRADAALYGVKIAGRGGYRVAV